MGVIHVLKDRRTAFKGKIKCIFQPAEEGLAGALRMIEDGVLEGVDAIFGYHNMPGIAIGQAGSRVGCLLASMSSFTLKIMGKGGHAAYPHTTVDPIVISAQVIAALQTIASRFTSPTEPVVVSVTHMDSGPRSFNIIPNSVTLNGTLRATSPTTKRAVIHHLRSMVAGICSAHRAKADVHISDGYPCTLNTADETAIVCDVIRDTLGADNLVEIAAPHLAAEDFSFYLQRVPGCFFFVGNGENSSGLHTSNYNFADAILPIAGTLMCKAALKYLEDSPSASAHPVNLTSQ